MDFRDYQQTDVKYMSETEISKAQAGYLTKVYTWMFGGLLLTAAIAFLTINSELLNIFISNRILYFGAIIAELGLVFYLSARINKMSAFRAVSVFSIYSALNGLTLSVILSFYTSSALVTTFLITAGMFGAMAAYGLITKKDLSAMGSFMLMGLFGIIILGLVNIFINSSMMSFLINLVGIIVFAGLTAYDNQKIKQQYEVQFAGNETATKGAIIGALMLYLDFINLFLFILRFVGGGSRD